MPWVMRSSVMASSTMPRPPTAASPMSSRPMPRSTICPRPPTAIMEAMTTIDRLSMSAWLMPAMMEGSASGSCTFSSICMGEAP